MQFPDGCFANATIIDSSKSLPCSGHGTCEMVDVGTFCKCHAGYTGTFCEHSKFSHCCCYFYFSEFGVWEFWGFLAKSVGHCCLTKRSFLFFSPFTFSLDCRWLVSGSREGLLLQKKNKINHLIIKLRNICRKKKIFNAWLKLITHFKLLLHWWQRRRQ